MKQIAITVLALLVLCTPLHADEPQAATSEQTKPETTTGAETNKAESSDAVDDPARLSAEEVRESVLSAMDRSADPCSDFYQYACGGWLKTTELPADQPRWSRSFSVLRERNREIVRSLIEEAAAKPGNDPDRQRIGAFYGSCIDERAIEEAGTKPLQPLLKEIATVKDMESLYSVAGHLHRMGIKPLLETAVLPDFLDPDRNIALFLQGGLGLPDKDYYLSEDETKQQLLADYEQLIIDMLQLVGVESEEATSNAAAIIAFETELAKASRDRAEMRQVDKLYNKIDIDGLKKLTPKLPWDAFLVATGHPEVTQINVGTPEFFESLERLLTTTEPKTMQAYLRWHAVNGTAGLLSSQLVNTHFAFYGKKLSGQQEIQPRWKRCVDSTQGALHEQIGRLYVERMFAGSSKAIAVEMIGDLVTAFGSNLPQLPWMDDTTRGRAAEKLALTTYKIGYPDKWRDYSSLKLSPGSYFDNVMAAHAFEFDFMAGKIGKAVDRGEWGMPPQSVNAYSNPLWNEIVFPAGILQPPFFHRDFPAAMNYGAVGGAIGHELTHGYDDQGRKFNAKGQMHEWWGPEVAERFDQRAQCVADAYSAFEIEEGFPVNGALTVGENIADIGGLKQAYQAYKLWEKRHGAPEPLIEGLSNDQLLFVAWSQLWCTVASDEYLRMLVTTDPHTPPMFRVIGPLANNPFFAETFSCEPGTPMNPKEKCVVW